MQEVAGADPVDSTMGYKDKEKQRRYQREWVAKNRAVWLAANGPCCKCGSWEDLEVDHKNPSEKVDHKVWSWSSARREAELAKCQVLCLICHKKKTKKEVEAPHGTHSRYVHHACRCVLCKKAHRIVNARYR